MLNQLKIKIFADGADLKLISELSKNPLIKGFTTNPTIMRKAGISDYKSFAHEAAALTNGLPISFEVFADDFDTMRAQAFEIATWGENVNVKIPVTNTKGESSIELIRELSAGGVQVNVTAVFTLDQTRAITEVLSPNTYGIISIFAGRIADTGQDPVPLMAEALKIMEARSKAELIWASPREVYNIFQADAVGCHIITVTYDTLEKLKVVGKDLNEFSRETVQMFYDDAAAAGYTID